MENNQKNNWHSQSVENIYKQFNTTINGLSHSEINKRLAQYGYNTLVQKQKKSSLLIFLEQFKSPLVYLLIIASIITFALGEMVDTYVIIAVVLINSIVGWAQEVKAENAMEAIKKLAANKTIVIRDDEETEISASELIPGDIVALKEGNKVPADLRIIEADNLKIDESNLTGESTTVRKNNKILDAKTVLADRVNMAYASTIIASGKGLGAVVNTGNSTEIGKIAKEIMDATEEVTPLNQKINNLGKYLIIITGVICAFIFILGIIKGEDIILMFLTAVSAAISAIPEGLPAIITIILAIGVGKMARQNAIVKKMQAVETLGAINIIASDKTGTLTFNQMSMEKIYLASGEAVEITGEGYNPVGKFNINNKEINPLIFKQINNLLLYGSLCNDAILINKDNTWQIQGDPTEGAIIVAGAKADIKIAQINDKYPRLDEIAFSSNIGYMATLHKDARENFIAAKGTIETILKLSKHYLKNNKTVILTEDAKKQIENQAIAEAKLAHRILAIAYKPKVAGTKINQKQITDLTYLGFVVLEDPPKTDAIDAIKKCHLSGIKPVMITGDHPETALAIAKKMSIAKNDSEIITGSQLAELNEADFKKIITQKSVFARITPEIKLKIVSLFQENKQIVGVTGDGVNDAPVLKKADVGIAMGIGGTDVAREAADIVLLDNNFQTIVNAIEEGRTIFLNIRRVIFFLTSTNLGELLIIITTLLFNLPLPLLPVQLLWINLVTDSTSGIALALEPKHKKIHELKPRKEDEQIINSHTLVRIILVATIMTIGTMLIYKQALANDMNIDRARSLAFVIMALFQIINIFNARSMTTSLFKLNWFSNKLVLPMSLLSIILTIATTQTAIGRNLFHTVALSFNEWIILFIISLSIFAIVEIDKFLRKT